MLRFIGKRLCYAVVTLFLITTATFFLVAGAPGDPIAAKVGQMPEQAQAIIREKYGLDKPLTERYTKYMKKLITTGDFGESIIYTGKSANDVIKENVWVSAKIGIVAMVLQLVIGLCLGLISALNRGKTVDNFIRFMVVLAICIPSFVFAALLQYFLAFKWRLVPVFGWGQLKHYILPVAAYTIGGIASYTKFMRASTLSVISEDYIITAKAKGCSPTRTVRKHILRNSMIPIITMIGPAMAGIFAGSFVLEKMFSIPGIGFYYVKAVSDNDYTMIIGLTIFFAILFVAALLFITLAVYLHIYKKKINWVLSTGESGAKMPAPYKVAIVLTVALLLVGIVSSYFIGYKVAYDHFEDSAWQLSPSDIQTFYAEVKEIETNSITVEGIALNEEQYRGVFQYDVWNDEINLSDLEQGDMIAITLLTAADTTNIFKIQLLQ